LSTPKAYPTPFHAVLDQRGVSNRKLTQGLAWVLGITVVLTLPAFLTFSTGVDLEIPLRAAARWSSGGVPYLASSFSEQSGPALPFLYPPWLLPLLAPVAALPRILVLVPWLAICAAAAVWTARRLSVPWKFVPLVLAWPPFAEGLVTGNVQILQFAAFAALFYLPGLPWSPTPRLADESRGRLGWNWRSGPRSLIARPWRDDLESGLLAAGVGAMKYTQVLPLVWLVRPRFRAAFLGGLAMAAAIAVMLPFTGIGLYKDWLDQLGRAADPSWALAGGPLAFVVGRPLALVATVLAVVGLFFVRGRDSGAWVGIALLVAAPSIHGYGMLFLLPALLTIRRDLAISLAVLVARYNIYGWWLSIAVAAIALAASSRYPALRAQPEGNHDHDEAILDVEPAPATAPA
jgi:Glycosyltransferase family 87